MGRKVFHPLQHLCLITLKINAQPSDQRYMRWTNPFQNHILWSNKCWWKNPNNNKRLEPADQGKILSQILIIAPHSIWNLLRNRHMCSQSPTVTLQKHKYHWWTYYWPQPPDFYSSIFSLGNFKPTVWKKRWLKWGRRATSKPLQCDVMNSDSRSTCRAQNQRLTLKPEIGI